jgi:hypothetical protein
LGLSNISANRKRKTPTNLKNRGIKHQNSILVGTNSNSDTHNERPSAPICMVWTSYLNIPTDFHSSQQWAEMNVID